MARVKAAKAGVLLLAMLILAGCWDRREINDVAFVVASALDWEDGQYRTTVQLPLPGQMGGVGSEGGGGGTSGNKAWYVESAKKDSIRLANLVNQTRLSRELYFSHQRVILFGEEMLRHGISSVLDLYARVPQHRLNVKIVATRGPAHRVLTINTPLEKTPAEMVREMVIHTMKNPPDLLTVANKLLTDGVDVVLPAYRVATFKNDNGKNMEAVELFGLAVFKDDKLAGFIQRDEITELLWLINAANNPPISVKLGDEKDGMVTIIFNQTSTRIRPIVNGDEIKMEVSVKGKGSVLEDDTRFDLVEDGRIEELKQRASEELKTRIERLLEKLQHEYQSDPVGFGLILYREKPRVWHRLENWSEVYPRVQMDVKVNLHIENTGPILHPFGIKENRQQ